MNDQTEIDWKTGTSFAKYAAFTVAEPPKPIGWWVMPGGSPTWNTKFVAYTKPNALVRFSMKYVFGWNWEDALKEKNHDSR